VPAAAVSELLPQLDVEGRVIRRRWYALTQSAQVLLASAIALLAALPIGRYLWIVVHRITYPFELEWMEGGSVEVVRRVVQGHNIYGPPSMRFTPWPYPPLYFWVSAAVSKVVGVGFFALRLVSFGASLFVLWLLYRIVSRETGDRIAGLVAAGIFAATFRLAGAWADIGRVDSLFLAFALGALLVARRAESPRQGAVAGLLFFCSFFTKQDGLLIALPVVAWMIVARRKVGVAALGVLGGLVMLSTVILDAFSHGWYQYYVFDELSSQGINPVNWVAFWRYDIFHPLAPVLWLTSAGVVALVVARKLSADWRAWGFWAAAAIGLVGTAWIGRLHLGGYSNVLMPAYAALALGAGLVIGLLRRHPQVLFRIAASAAVVGLVWIQTDRIAFPVDRQIPTAADRRAGESFLALVRRLPGQVIVFDHPYYSTLAGKGSFADEEAVGDIERSHPSRARDLLITDMHQALLRRGVGALILDNSDEERNLEAELRSQYRLLPMPAVEARAFFPVTDLPWRPTLVFVRIGDPR